MRRPLDQQSSGEFAPAVSATRTCHASVQANGYVAEIHVRAHVYSQPFQSRTPSHRPRHVQDPSLRCHCGMEESCKLKSANAGFLGVDSVTLTVPHPDVYGKIAALSPSTYWNNDVIVSDVMATPPAPAR